MARERDERWVYVALAALGLAYLAYRMRASIHVPPRSLSKLASSSIAYAAAPLVGILAQLAARKRAEALRRRLADSMRQEGLLREERAVRTWIGDSSRNSFQADVHLTRSALYVVDLAGRRSPMRFALRHGSSGDHAVRAVALAAEPGSDDGAVRVEIDGPARKVIGFVSSDARGWRSEIRRAVPATVA